MQLMWQSIFLSTLILSVAKQNQKMQVQHSCKCVPIFLCENTTEVVNGVELLDIRSTEEEESGKEWEMSECENILQICCEPANIKSHTNEQVLPTYSQTSARGCGIRNFNGVDTKIMSASPNEAKFAEFPWMIAVLHKAPKKLDVYLCGGSLIHRKVVLTAAHCVYRRNSTEIKIRAGEWNTQSPDDILPHQDRAVEEILIHENYSPRSLHSDIALLILGHAVKIAENVNIICLPQSNFDFDRSNCIATGWGRNKFDGQHQETLKTVQLSLVPRISCQNGLRRTRLGSGFMLDKSFICAGGLRREDTCEGDGGSPLICPLRTQLTRYVQVGIVSWGIECGNNLPGVYASVLHMRPWIDEQLLFRNLDYTVYQYRMHNA